MRIRDEDGQVSMFDQDTSAGKTSPARSPAREGETSTQSSSRSSGLKNHRFMFLDLRPGAGNLLGPYWEYDPPWLGQFGMLNTSESPSVAVESSLSQILEASVPSKYYLTKKACSGILRRAKDREKELPPQLKDALELQAGIRQANYEDTESSGTLADQKIEGFDGYNSDLTGDVAATLGVNCGMSTGRNGIIAFAANQRDEVRDLHDVAGALGAQPGMKQQTFVAGIVSKGNGDCFLTPEVHTSLSGGGGQAGQGYPCVLTQTEEPTKEGVLCLNDQGGERMDCTYDQTATLRAQMQGHPPLVFENHALDSRYTGPHEAAPTISASYGTGGNNTSLVMEDPVYCITGNAINRQPQNGGNGMGYQENISYTLTATDRHAVFNRQRVDRFQQDDVASTQSARQHKDATDLVCQPTYQETVGTLTSDDYKGPNSQYVDQDKLIVDGPMLIRRLIPLECERLQGFPDGWTDIPKAADAARYKALGNSVAIPCVEYLLRGVAHFLKHKGLKTPLMKFLEEGGNQF